MALWGATLWKILHAIGERISCLPQCKKDTLRELKWMIENLEKIVPCYECCKHIVEYRRINTLPDSLEGYKYWIWKFHESVNERLGKVGVAFNDIDASCDIKETWKEYKNLMGKYIILRRVKGENLKIFGRHLHLWIGFSS